MSRPFKIIGVDNLARETVADKPLHSCVPDTLKNRAKAKQYCAWLNEFTCHDNGGTFYKVV